jgi:hypothetical protein
MIETDCAITFHGRKYEANGAMITDRWIIAYMSNDMGSVTDWHGETLGHAKVKTSWATPTNDRCYQVECNVNGITYTGRTGGGGMIYKGKVKR